MSTSQSRQYILYYTIIHGLKSSDPLLIFQINEHRRVRCQDVLYKPLVPVMWDCSILGNTVIYDDIHNTMLYVLFILFTDLSCSTQDHTGRDLIYVNANDSLCMTCRAEYWSNWDLLMSWSTNDSTTFDANITHSTNQSAETSLILGLEFIHSVKSPVRFMLRIYFQVKHESVSDATNVPDIIWSSPIIASLHTS